MPVGTVKVAVKLPVASLVVTDAGLVGTTTLSYSMVTSESAVKPVPLTVTISLPPPASGVRIILESTLKVTPAESPMPSFPFIVWGPHSLCGTVKGALLMMPVAEAVPVATTASSNRMLTLAPA